MPSKSECKIRRGVKGNSHVMDNVNGHYNLRHLKDSQEQRFESLERVLKDGFQGVTEELKLLREQGYVPVSVLQKITDQQRALIYPVIKVLAASLILVLVWFTGLKAILPHIFHP